MSEHKFLGCRIENCPNCAAILEELRAHDEADKCYYRPILYKIGKFEPVCLQWFDEYDYPQDKFLNDIQYETEEECQDICDRVYLFCATYPTPLIGFVSPKTIWRLYKKTWDIKEEE